MIYAILLASVFSPASDGYNFGVEFDKIDKSPKYTRNGKEVTKRQAIEAVGKVNDDTGKLRLTVIGPDADRKAVLADIAKAPWRDSVLVQDYPPDHWTMRVGFVTTGKPTIYVQTADGKVKHRQDDYAGGIDRLTEAVRKADPNYKPDADPDLTKNPLIPANLPKWLPWAAGAVGLYLLLRKRD